MQEAFFLIESDGAMTVVPEATLSKKAMQIEPYMLDERYW